MRRYRSGVMPSARFVLKGRQVSLFSLEGGTPHESWGNWLGFLRSCEVRDMYRNVVFFGASNCNYILFPTGEILCNFGYHGKNVMQDVRTDGWRSVLRKAKVAYAELDPILERTRGQGSCLETLAKGTQEVRTEDGGPAADPAVAGGSVGRRGAIAAGAVPRRGRARPRRP